MRKTSCSSATTARLRPWCETIADRRSQELVRRMNLVSCDHDPVPPMVRVLGQMPREGVPLGDVICDSGYAHLSPRALRPAASS